MSNTRWAPYVVVTYPGHEGMSQTEWNRLRDRLDQQTWTKADVERLQERVRRVAAQSGLPVSRT